MQETGDAPPVSSQQLQSALRSAEDELQRQRELIEISDSEVGWREDEIRRDLEWASLADQRGIALELAKQCVDRQFGRKDPEFLCGS